MKGLPERQEWVARASFAERLDKEAKRRRTSVAALVTELVQRKPERLPYAKLIEDDEDLSQKVEEVLARLSRRWRVSGA